MPKITFMGAGSTVFAKNIIGDSFCAPALSDSEIALYDIDAERLRQSEAMLNTINKNINSGRAKIKTYLGVENRKKALKGSNFVVNAIQVGGYEPSTVIDFEIPKKYGLRQTIADTLGIGGIFRTLRTLPVMLDFAADMEKVCPDAWLLNYTNPMAMLTGGMLRGTSVKTVGLCHSVQENALHLLKSLGLLPEGVDYTHGLRQKVAGINHMAWLLEVDINGKDMYPAIKAAAAAKVEESLREKDPAKKSHDMVRLDLIRHLGYYITESSEHNAEYTPYWIKRARPELIELFNIPLDEYPRRCISQIAGWKKQYKDVCENPALTHTRTHEFGSYIMEAITTNVPFQIAGNVLNKGFITNLPADCCVEVPCLVDANGVQGTYVGALPPQCAALNLTNINVQNLTIEAVLTKKREHIYHAAMLDPHTAAELALDDIVKLCDELIAAHGDYLPKYK